MNQRQTGQIIMDAYASSNTNLTEICRELPQPHNDLVNLIIELNAALNLPDQMPAVMKKAEKHLHMQHEDHDLYLIFMVVMAFNSNTLGQTTQARLLLDQIKDAIRDSTHRGIMSWVHLVESACHRMTYDFDSARKCLDHMFENIDTRSSFYLRWITSYLTSQFGLRDYSDYKVKCEFIENNFNGDPIIEKSYLHFKTRVDLQLVGNAQHLDTHAHDFIENCHYLSKLSIFSRPVLMQGTIEALQFADLMLGRDTMYLVRKHGLTEHIDDNTIVSPTLSITADLVANKAESALEKALLMWGHTSQLRWYPAIRSQLSSGNAISAKQLLLQRQNHCGHNLLDDLFLARIELLQGSSELASQFFNSCLAHAKTHNALPLIKFELQQSCELPRDILFDWMEMFASSEHAPADETMPSLLIEREQTPAATTETPRTLIASEPWLSEFHAKVLTYAASPLPVLIHGETGTGKDLAARALHDQSPRKHHPYVSINCGTLSTSLLQSELFGHVKGSFTGAASDHPGIFEQAENGTLFLDEIGDAPLDIQLALLKVVENKEYRSIGSTETKKVNCRLVFATNINFEEQIAAKTFRQDFYYRINQLTLWLPPLRERRQDIQLIADHYLNANSQRVVTLSPELLHLFENYAWPGNIRQLVSEIEYLKLMSSDKTILTPEDLRSEFYIELEASEKLSEVNISRREPVRQDPTPAPVGPGFKNSMETRRDVLLKLFEEHKYLTRLKIIELLKISPNTATSDLKALSLEGKITKITPSASPRSHYFSLNEDRFN